MIYMFLAEGFEEVEAFAPLDILRRAGVEVETVSITDNQVVAGAHGIIVLADRILPAIDFDDAEMIILPGGLPGSTNLDACEDLRAGIQQLYDAGKPLAAICAAPQVYGHMGLLKGVKCTCYPGVESELLEAQPTGALVEVDGQFITGKGPAAAFEFGYTIAEKLVGKEKVQALRDGMIYSELKA
ncbi:MAG: DJ-1/PfpI family protein [Bacteroidaceae bacterium]|nr:DJ-1/PfpI family protein [Bacteroidaceae bacterium]